MDVAVVESVVDPGSALEAALATAPAPAPAPARAPSPAPAVPASLALLLTSLLGEVDDLAYLEITWAHPRISNLHYQPLWTAICFVVERNKVHIRWTRLNHQSNQNVAIGLVIQKEANKGNGSQACIGRNV